MPCSSCAPPPACGIKAGARPSRCWLLAHTDQQSDIVLAQLSQEMYNSGLLLLLLKNMHRIDFEVVIEQVL